MHPDALRRIRSPLLYPLRYGSIPLMYAVFALPGPSRNPCGTNSARQRLFRGGGLRLPAASTSGACRHMGTIAAHVCRRLRVRRQQVGGIRIRTRRLLTTRRALCVGQPFQETSGCAVTVGEISCSSATSLTWVRSTTGHFSLPTERGVARHEPLPERGGVPALEARTDDTAVGGGRANLKVVPPRAGAEEKPVRATCGALARRVPAEML